ncbi:hypothetical protein FNF27_00210 [Cafeteria roenbergensis]|uniref:Uncharacterized protein n=1 Tax=Cafeteria roenbergensis TaxID=33653 RepID=A0A5A8EQS5_CAFRO|nr:hypothetical protein FNF27_00210 [Cafeteria roenbergensis]
MRLVATPDGATVVAAFGSNVVVGTSGPAPEARVCSGDGHTPGTVISELAVSPCGTMAASAGEDKRLCVWDVRSAKLVGFLPARAISALAFALTDVPGSGKTLLVFWGERTGNVCCAPASDPASGSRVMLAHTGSVISDIAVAPGVILSADNDETVRLTALPFGHRILGHVLGHAGAVQRLCLLPGGRTVVSVGADASVRFSALQPPCVAVADPVVLPGGPPAAVEFVGGPLADMVSANGARPSRAEASAAAAAGKTVTVAPPDVSAEHEAEALAAGLATIPRATGRPSADGAWVSTSRPVPVHSAHIGHFDSGFVCSGAATSPRHPGLLVLAVSAPPEAVAAAADGQAHEALCKAASLKARGKRPRPGADAVTATSRPATAAAAAAAEWRSSLVAVDVSKVAEPPLATATSGPAPLPAPRTTDLGDAPARWSELAFAADGTLLATARTGRVAAHAVTPAEPGAWTLGAASADSPGFRLAAALNAVLEGLTGPSCDAELEAVAAAESGAAMWRSA